MKGFYLWKCKFYKLCVCNLVSGLLQIACNQKKTMTLQYLWHDVIATFFDFVLSFCQVQLLVQVSCQYRHWSWSYDNFFYKRLTKNPEIGNIPVSVLPNICRLGQVRGTKFGTNISNEMLLNTAKCQGYSFRFSWVTKEESTGG